MALKGSRHRAHKAGRHREETREEPTATPDGLHGISDAWHAVRRWVKGIVNTPTSWRKEAEAMRSLRRYERRALKLNRARCPIWRTLSIAVVIFASVFSLQLLLNLIEPFGLDKALKVQSARISARLMAPFYGSAAQDHLAVVLIDEEALRRRGEVWPPPYLYFTTVVRRVLAKNPRSVYVDIMSADERPYDGSLIEARAELSVALAESLVPLWWGTVSPAVPSLFESVPGVGVATAGWKQLGDAYPLTIAPENVLRDNSPGTQKPTVAKLTSSPAWLLYQAGCSPRRPGCAHDARMLTRGMAAKPISVHWGATRPVAPSHTPGRTGRCTRTAAQGPGFFTRAEGSFGAAWHSFRSGSDEALLDRHRERCPYTLTVFEDELDDDDVAELLRGRIVLIGASLAAVNDSTTSPVHQRLPGVYMHAMALDNLMTWGPNRLHVRPVNAQVVMFISALLMSLGMALGLRHAAGLTRRMIFLATALIATVGASAWLYYVERQPPGDWLGMLALFVVVFTAVRPKKPST